jgi:RHS repeat-associated protein
VHSTVYDPTTGNATEATQPAGNVENPAPAYSSSFGSYGKEIGQLLKPTATALDASGNVWVTDESNHRVDKYSASGAFLAAYGKEGTENGQFKEPKGIAFNQSTGNFYVSDTANNRVQEFNSEGKWLATFGITGEGKLSRPELLSVDSSGHVWVNDAGNNRVVKFSASGAYETKVGSAGSGNGQLSNPGGQVVVGNNLYVADYGNHRIEEFSTTGEYKAQFNTTGTGHLLAPEGIALEPKSGNLIVTDAEANNVVEYTQAGKYLTEFGNKGTGGGQFRMPEGLAVTSTGTIYIADDSNARIDVWGPANSKVHTSQTIYYSSKTEASVLACQNHPEWANLPCQTQPAHQPEVAGLPELPVTTYTYNIWDEPEKTTATVESKTRTTTSTYDAAGRLKTTAATSTVGTALPTITDEYNTETGALEKQCANEGKPCTEGKPETITNTYNKRGQLEAYTDADENKSTHEYDEDGRVKKTNDGKGTQTYTYDKTTGLLSELVDTSHEGVKFTATYDPEGNMVSEGYPNGMSANRTLDPTGRATALEYKKITHCTEEKEKCKWFTDSVVPSIHGQWLEQTSTLSHQAYIYDAAGRLIQVQNTPTGKGCTTRIYTYDEETNRTSLTTREPNSKNECATEGGTVETHGYDTVNRLLDSTTTYNTFGDITSLPATDAGGSELTSSYYVDNQLQSQTQNGQTIGYQLDPAGRTRETISTGKTNSTITSHYAGPSNAPAWTVNTTSEWKRNIPGISGSLVAIQNNGETPVLQLTNLHGDLVATASVSETATELASKADTTEFGVPAVSAPAKYSWLGAIGLPTELPSGVIAMGARSYVPQLGRFLQPDAIQGGSANAYAYTFGDPVNSSDPTGAYAATVEASDYIGASRVAAAAVAAREAEIAAERAARRAAEEAAARTEAEYAAIKAAWAASWAAGPQYTGGGQEEGGGEEQVGGGEEVIWESGGGGCSGTSACAADFLGFKVDFGEINEWWRKVKKGYALVKETITEGLQETFRENSTVCKVVGYAGAVGSAFIPASRFGRALGIALGAGTTYAC